MLKVSRRFKSRNSVRNPNRADCRSVLAAGTFYWNSGIFLWRASTILDALEDNVPEMREHIAMIADAMGSDSFEATLEREFTAIKGTRSTMP